MSAKDEKNKRISELEAKISQLNEELADARFQTEREEEQRLYYQFIADFAFAWELWFEPNGTIKYCSPSCYDLTGFTANQVMASSGVKELLVYESYKSDFENFLKGALQQTVLQPTFEFQILTRSKQLRWCLMSVRGVYNKTGKYLGIRASVQDITQLKKAMGHISALEKGKQFDQRNRDRLRSELDLKDRELVTFLMQLSQKNELLSKARNLLHKKEPTDKLLNELSVLLNGGASQQVDWGMIEPQIEKIHPGFLERLSGRYPTISVKDKRLCSYVRLGLSSKEIAGLLNITPKSVEIARVRLRKKLNMPPRKRLIDYLIQV